MRDKLRKKAQANLNHIVRKINKDIQKDNLWLGRFEMRQIDCAWERFSDNSGGMLYVVFRCYDKKTKYYKDYPFDFVAPKEIGMTWHLYNIINKFIVDDTNVWAQTPNPRDKDFVEDFTKQLISDSLMRRPYNYHKKYEV